MTRKQLPKAIKPTGSPLRVVEGAEIEEQAPVEPRPREPVAAQTDDWPASPPPANDPLPVASPAGIAIPAHAEILPPLSQTQAEGRLRDAFRIVERHKMYAGLGGLVPMPAVNVVTVTAVILRMVKTLSDLYGVPFEREKTRTIVIGLMGGAAPSGLAAATAATFAFVAPIAAPLGLAVSTVTAASLTRRIGLNFVERFEREAV